MRHSDVPWYKRHDVIRVIESNFFQEESHFSPLLFRLQRKTNKILILAGAVPAPDPGIAPQSYFRCGCKRHRRQTDKTKYPIITVPLTQAWPVTVCSEVAAAAIRNTGNGIRPWTVPRHPLHKVTIHPHFSVTIRRDLPKSHSSRARSCRRPSLGGCGVVQEVVGFENLGTWEYTLRRRW